MTTETTETTEKDGKVSSTQLQDNRTQAQIEARQKEEMEDVSTPPRDEIQILDALVRLFIELNPEAYARVHSYLRVRFTPRTHDHHPL